jgi:hypothetical protein
VVTLQRLLRSVTAKQVNREETKTAIRDFVDTYFRDHRRALRTAGMSEDSLASLDTHLQELLRFTHTRTSTQHYRSLLGTVKKDLNNLELDTLPTGIAGAEDAKQKLDLADSRIVTTLDGLAPRAAASYRQALSDLQTAARESWRGTALELREALRETLDTLAPDSDVESEPGFSLEKDAKRPTMKQKVSFLLRSRKKTKAAVGSAAKTVQTVEEQTGVIARSVYDRSSASVHGAPTRDEVITIKRYVATVLSELLEIPE